LEASNFDTHKEDGTNDHGIVCAAFRYRPIKEEAKEIVGGGSAP
jgi:hypothetical protein